MTPPAAPVTGAGLGIVRNAALELAAEGLKVGTLARVRDLSVRPSRSIRISREHPMAEAIGQLFAGFDPICSQRSTPRLGRGRWRRDRLFASQASRHVRFVHLGRTSGGNAALVSTCIWITR